MAVCMDDTAMQFVLAMLIIGHLAVVHQCLDACNEILGGPLLAWLLSLQVLQDAHGCWHRVSFPAGFGQGRQKLLPWLLSVSLHCQLASIVHAFLGIWCLGLQKHTWGGPCCLAECSWGGASSPGYGKIWRKSGKHLESHCRRLAG